MKTIPLNIFFLSVLLSVLSCKQNPTETPAINTVLNTGSEATCPYLTLDNKGNAVLCWTERSPEDSLYRLKYAYYDSKTNKLAKPITVSPSVGTKASPESMNKIAFKSDGTIIAVFSRKFENQQNPFAGAILYSSSTDQGRSWSEAKYLHSDTAHTYGRNYFDLARMKNGEIAAIWLDGRYGKADKGSALFFAGTTKGKGFENEKCIDRHTCECCRTDLLVSGDGKLNIAWRSIMFPDKLMGQQVRDMAYTFSDNNGDTFETIKTISNDNWAIEGCPHTGPSLASNTVGVYALWFTAGKSAGVYLNSCNKSDSKFSPRELQSAAAHHPQLTSLQDDRLAMVWEENEKPEAAAMAMSGHHQGMDMSHKQKATSAKIYLKITGKGQKKEELINLTDGKQVDNHAVITPVNNGLLVAWVTENKNTSGIRYSFIKPNE